MNIETKVSNEVEEGNPEMTFKIGDRVTRKNINAFRYMQGTYGTIILINEFSMCKIKWDDKASTGQQHSTINPKFLVLVNNTTTPNP